jgi:hypothetical protein
MKFDLSGALQSSETLVSLKTSPPHITKAQNAQAANTDVCI